MISLQVSAKETSRRRRKETSIQTLCEIVPGVDDKTDDTKALELAAKYILFLKTRVNPDHDKEFLRKQIIQETYFGMFVLHENMKQNLNSMNFF